MESSPTTRRMQIEAEVVENRDLGPAHPDHFRLVIHSPRLAERSRPGQFLHILPPRSTELLRRPFSIMTADALRGDVTILFRVVGEGTRLLASVAPEERLDIIGPLGNGFPIESNRPAILVGGGVGIPPLVYLAEKIEKCSIFLGAKDRRTLICVEDFSRLGISPGLATEDGSVGFEGLVTEALEHAGDFDPESVVYACGPIPMLKAVARWAAARELQCRVSLENKLGCGIGACLGCSIPVRSEDGSIRYERVCCDGPVFDAYRVAFDLM